MVVAIRSSARQLNEGMQPAVELQLQHATVGPGVTHSMLLLVLMITQHANRASSGLV